MRITIQGGTQTPTWDTLQTLIRESFDDETALLVRISRKDGGCDYRTHGLYDLTALTDDGRVLEQIVYKVL